MPFKPGKSGNPAGRPKGKSKSLCASRRFTALIRVALSEKSGGKTKLQLVAETLIAEGLKGNVEAIKEIGDRLDGKAARSRF